MPNKVVGSVVPPCIAVCVSSFLSMAMAEIVPWSHEILIVGDGRIGRAFAQMMMGTPCMYVYILYIVRWYVYM